MEQLLKDSDLKTLKLGNLVIRALNHKLRRIILQTLIEKPNSTVTQIYITLRLEQSVCSQHLAILRRADIVECKREGKFIIYTVNQNRIQSILQQCKELADPTFEICLVR